MKANSMKLLLLVMLLVLVPTANAQMQIVANARVPKDSLNALQVRDIYTLNERQWGDGTKIVPIILKGSGSCMDSFYDAIGRKPLEMRKLWMLAKLTGASSTPIAVESDEEVVALVARTPGAVGIIHVGSPTGSTKIMLTVHQ